MRRPSPRRVAPIALPLITTAVVIGMLAIAQFRWLTELGDASRERMERDLRVAVQTVVAEVALEVSRLHARLEAVGGDSTARAAVLRAWQESAPALSGLYPDAERIAVDTTRFALTPDSTYLADSLLPELARRIGTLALVGVSLAVERGDAVIARAGPPTEAPPDVVAPIALDGGGRRIVFVSQALGTSSQPNREVSWTPAEEANEPRAESDVHWKLLAWHESGSLERAVGLVRRRNLAVGFGLMAVLVASAAMTVVAFRRNERLAADRATILAGISHEIRTPIAVIRSAADNLIGGVVSGKEPVREYGKIIERETARLQDSVEGALAFARAAARGISTHDEFDLAELVRDARQASSSAERIEVIAAGAVPCRGDRRAIAVAVRNLIENALLYSPPDQPIQARVDRADSGTVVLAIADRGLGIGAAERERIYDPFYRGGAGVASEHAGLGLGLALAHRVATLHRGRLRSEDRPGGGTVFRLTLPAG